MFFPTLVQDYLTLSAQKFPSKEALICGQQRWTYAALDRASSQLASVLVEIGVQRQDRVVVFLDNSSEAVISLYGILKAMGVFVIVNGALKAQKLAYVLKDSGATVLITHTSKRNVVSEAINQLEQSCQIIWVGPAGDIPPTLTSTATSWEDICGQNGTTTQQAKNFAPRSIDVDLAALIYTSGSTGEPKGVMSTHHNMLSAAKSIIQYLENREDDIILDVLPLSFDYGLYQVIMSVIFGGTIVLEKSFVFLHLILSQIQAERVTGFPIVPTILAMLLKMEDLKKYDFGSLRYLTNTGAALPVEHIRQLRNLFPDVKLYSMFGLTECKRVCYLPPDQLDQRPASVGQAMPNCEVFILDETGQEVAPGVTGELVIRGSNVMKGYWNAPELTAKYYKPDRYLGEMRLHSGDYFKKDEDGFLYFIGRKDDMIKSKGERISAKEIENVICEMKGVTEVAVVGLPDEILGQAIKAFVVLHPSSGLTENDILKHCSQQLEPYAVPKFIELVKDLPRTPHGKIDKKLLKNS